MKKFIIWLDKRYVISKKAQRSAIYSKVTGFNFDAIYDGKPLQ